MSDAPLTPLELFTIVALGEDPSYGYELTLRIESLSGGRLKVRPGNLYRVIHRLIDRGLVADHETPDIEGDDRRQYFRATPEGQRRAREEAAMYAGLARGLGGGEAADGV